MGISIEGMGLMLCLRAEAVRVADSLCEIKIVTGAYCIPC